MATIEALQGETLIVVDGMLVGSERVRFETASGRTFEMYHEQDCCESVTLNDIAGNVHDLLGAPILKAEATSNSNDPKPNEYSDSWTWTFYTLATLKGYVVLRWLGESNGYYSEDVSFCEVPA